MKKTAFALALVFILCALLIKPNVLSEVMNSVQTAASTRIHSAWKQQAESIGDVRTFEENVYYTQTKEENIIPLNGQIAFVNNELIVYFKDGTAAERKQNVIENIGAQVIGYTDILNKYQLQLPQEKSFSALQTLCAKLCCNPSVLFASCNMAQSLREDIVPDDPWSEPESGESAIVDWDESKVYGGNWWLKATQTVSAWEYEKYFHPIRVGILDSGFETDHEDLQNKFQFPSGFYARTNIPSSHGTHVAGIISANANNKIGITGICNNAEMMCVDWLPQEMVQYWSTNERIFTGVIALIKSGAKVINLSLGAASGFDPTSKVFLWKLGMNLEGTLFSFMMASLLARGYDFLVVQSAGNGDKNGQPCDSFYNGSFTSIRKNNIFTGLTRISKQDILDHILIVGSATSAHKQTEFYQSSFSNYGDGVSIFAPGSFIFSTDLTENGGYSYKSGTSMAAPVVTGIAALTWSVNPALSAAQIKQILCNPDNQIYTVKNYYNDELEIPAYPMINAKLSVEAAIRTLNEPEEPSTEEEQTTEPESEFIVHPTIPSTGLQPQAQTNHKVPVSDNSDKKYIESFRGEIGE